MQKDHLPKLELSGFTTPDERRTPAAQGREIKAPAGWRHQAARMMNKAGVKIVWKNESAEDDIDVGYKRLLVKTGICAAIAIAILIISTVTTPGGPQRNAESLNGSLSREFDIDEDIGKLKFVENFDDEAESVMSVLPDTAVVYPSDGAVITAFGQSGAKGVRFSSEGTTAYSIARATVTSVGEIDGQGYAKLLLDTGETALYCNIEPLVQTDDIVGAGQTIGTLSGDYLYVEMKDGDTFVDPIAYINGYTLQ
jgi:Peptidase family M23.